MSESATATTTHAANAGDAAAISAAEAAKPGDAPMSGSPTLSSTWRTSPLERRPGRTVACAVAIGAFSILFGVVAGDWLWGSIAAVMLLLVTMDAFVATTYVTDASGLRIHGPLRSRQVRWQDVVRVAAEADGALLVMKSGGGVTVLLDSPQRGQWLAQRATKELAA